MKTLFSAEQVETAVEIARQETSRKTARKSYGAVKTPFGSHVVRNHEVTETAKLDLILIAGLALAEGHRVTVDMLNSLATQVGFDLKARRIRKHIKDNKIASLDNQIVFLNEDQVPRYVQVVQSAWYKQLCLHFAAELATLLNIREDDFVLLVPEDRKTRIAECHIEAVQMNKPKVIKRKRSKVAAK